MLVEIPDPGVILGMLAAFFVGAGGLYAFYKVRPFVRRSDPDGPLVAERLEYYEKQLIDMKIRLDALDMQESPPQKPATQEPDLNQILAKLVEAAVKEHKQEEPVQKEPPQQVTRVPPPAPMHGFDHNSVIDHVLHLITDRAMTSRDIQITLGRSREHTSRLMKKLFEEGYVERSDTTPYVYQIAQAGRDRISKVELPPTTTA